MENINLGYAIIILGVLVIILFIWAILLSKKIKKLTMGSDGKSLEKVIIETNKKTKSLEKVQDEHYDHLNSLNKELMKKIGHVSVTRFDALNEMGGKQSFAISFLDNHKNGVVMSSMYTRDRMNVFAKEIINGKSNRTLTKEEQNVINN